MLVYSVPAVRVSSTSSNNVSLTLFFLVVLSHSIISLDVRQNLLSGGDSDTGSLVLDEDVLDDTVLYDGGVALRAVVAQQA